MSLEKQLEELNSNLKSIAGLLLALVPVQTTTEDKMPVEEAKPAEVAKPAKRKRTTKKAVEKVSDLPEKTEPKVEDVVAPEEVEEVKEKVYDEDTIRSLAKQLALKHKEGGKGKEMVYGILRANGSKQAKLCDLKPSALPMVGMAIEAALL